MALSTSPRKIVPLATGDDSKASLSGPSTTKRSFYCAVVVESSGPGYEYSEDVQDLLLSLGTPLDLEDSTSSSDPSHPNVTRDLHSKPDPDALASVISELVSTERSYVQRLKHLVNAYALPLRDYARSKDTMILPPYEANTLFGNVEALLPVNEAFLTDLEYMLTPDGPRTVGGVGDVALRHFRDHRGFENYRLYYDKREQAQTIFEREMSKKSSSFVKFVDRIKYSSESRNRVGLRELMMEPVQRVPRYTLLFRLMIKHMQLNDPQRAKLQQADEIASRIAQAETDEQTRRGAIMYRLGAVVQNFPPGLISHSRRLLDCIDVEDDGGEEPLPATLFLFDDKLLIVKRPGGDKGGRALAGLDEIEKGSRAGAAPPKKSGLVCKGVIELTDVVATDVGGADMHVFLETPPEDDSEKWARPFRALTVVCPPLPAHMSPSAAEGAKMRFLENLWTAQARYRTRAGQSVVMCAEEREVEARGTKVTLARAYFNVYQRTSFLKEARKTKVVVHIDELGCADAIPFGSGRPPFVVIRVQPMAGEVSRYIVTSSDPNDEPEEDIVQSARVHSRIVQTIHQYGLFKFRTGNNSVPGTPTASTRSRAAIFNLDAISRNLFGATGSVTRRADLISGTLNGSYRRARSKSAASAVSRSSLATVTSNTTGTTEASSIMWMSSRSNSSATTATTATTMSSVQEEVTKTPKRKLLKRGKSAGPSEERPESRTSVRSKSPSFFRALSRSPSLPRSRSPSERAPSRGGESEYSDDDEEGVGGLARGVADESDWKLTARLELARKNSRTNHEVKTVPLQHPTEDTIYEDGDTILDEPPQTRRPLARARAGSEPWSRLSRSTSQISRASTSTAVPSNRSTTPTPDTRPQSPNGDGSSCHSRSRSADRRPMGPRSASPLPPTSPRALPIVPLMAAVSLDDEREPPERTISIPSMMDVPVPSTPSRSPIPRSRRMPFERASTDSTPSKRVPFEPTTNFFADATPRAAAVPPKVPPSVEPLAIKKKSSVRSSTGGVSSPAPARRSQHPRLSPMKMSPMKAAASARPSALPKPIQIPLRAPKSAGPEAVERLIKALETTKEDTESASRAVKRIKLQVDHLRKSRIPSPVDTQRTRIASPVDMQRTRIASPVEAHTPISPSTETLWGRSSPTKLATPSSTTVTKEAQARMDEMRALIGRRKFEGPSTPRPGPSNPRPRPLSVADASIFRQQTATPPASPAVDEFVRTVEEPIFDLDQGLKHIAETQDAIANDVKSLAAELSEKSAEAERKTMEVQQGKLQHNALKDLLDDAVAEKDILFDTFNEELGKMFDDVNLPRDESWQAMARDLHETKQTRNAYAKENLDLKRKVAELEMQQEHWGALLRAHGLIP